jgi:hypothetical protein
MNAAYMRRSTYHEQWQVWETPAGPLKGVCGNHLVAQAAPATGAKNTRAQRTKAMSIRTSAHNASQPRPGPAVAASSLPPRLIRLPSMQLPRWDRRTPFNLCCIQRRLLRVGPPCRRSVPTTEGERRCLESIPADRGPQTILPFSARQSFCAARYSSKGLSLQ